jgi:hypothetical protein
MHSMNGNPIWCRPARTREYDFAAVEEPSEEELSILAEAAQLVAAGIKAGLISVSKDTTPIPPSALGNRGAQSVRRPCEKCGEEFSHHWKRTLTICFPCRLGAINCKCCGVSFRRTRSHQTVCTNACKYKHQASLNAVRSNATNVKRVDLDCPVCGKKFSMRSAGGRVSKTCGKECGKVLMIQKIKGRKKNK